MLVTNLQKGPRGFYARDELVLLEPGEQREVALSAVELKVARATGWFQFDVQASDAGTNDNKPKGRRNSAGS
ncbi:MULTISPECIES: hypothetical protein [unclassified Beijerinckia]|uniref:hypothetical protein n=1 Tax=unclassified Beijerinckia TaxID=2638183 RepID=UPI000895D7FB|nr:MULTISPECIES: hypothetical protein [unclassified Beijerinckia]MDH7794112.1 hypothetical protein [Beijerinckia sp. GAS462]SEB53569.1 hypothetical protein SAMN05443249_0378 [Beijerinckia sp. 28-YEA-48]